MATAWRRRSAGYLLVLPVVLWLAVFFVVPFFVRFSLSLQTGDLVSGFRQTFHWSVYPNLLSAYHDQLVRSVWYAGAATIATILLGYPAAYWIAFYGGRRKSTYLFLLLLPFFVTFVLRTVAWQFLLGDNGLLLGPLHDHHVVSAGFHVLATSWAVIGGLAYNYLPFTVLPIYVALERIDRRLIEAAADLYAARTATFLRIVLPLSIPGVFAAVLLTFVPATTDYVEAAILGGPGQTMIGNIIQTLYLTNADYPGASALSVVVTGALLVFVLLYARVLGTRDVFRVTAA